MKYRYRIGEKPSLLHTWDSLLLAVFAAEGIHGQARVRLEADFDLDEMTRTFEVDASTEVGRTIAQVFTGLLTREFGEAAFEVGYVQSDRPGEEAA